MSTAEEISALDVRALGQIDFKKLKRSGGLIPVELPTAKLGRSSLDTGRVAVISWRWDVASLRQRSMNVAAAVYAAHREGYDYLLFDAVSVMQTRDAEELIRNVADLAGLFSSLPVFAAYDHADVTDWLPTMRRPWLFFEARAFYHNQQPITYVSHQKDQGGANSFGFNHMLKRVWGTNYTSTALLVLFGRTGIGKLSDFAYIIPHHRSFLSTIVPILSRNDFLLTVALLSQVFYDDGRFHVGSNDPGLDLKTASFDRYRLVSARGDDPVYDYYDILLDGDKVASYYERTKQDRFTSETTYVRYLISDVTGGEKIHTILYRPSVEGYRRKRRAMQAAFSLPSRKDGDLTNKIIRLYSK